MLSILDLEVTSHCNLQCRWCFVTASGRARHMTREIAWSALTQARALGADTLHLTGGEPLVWPHLLALLEEAVRLGYNQVLLNTNGLLLHEDLLAFLSELPLRVRLTISLDGPAEIHEANRGVGTHAKVLAGIQEALQAGLAVQVFTIAGKSLLPLAKTFARDLFQRFAELDGIHFIPIGDVGQSDSQALDAAELVDLVALSAAFLLAGRTVKILDFPVANLVYRALKLPVSLVGSHCTACRSRIAVQSDGTVTPCHPVWAPVGRLQDETLEQVLVSPLCELVRDRRYAACADCPDREICGHCRAVVLGAGLAIEAHDGFCHAVRAELARRLDLTSAVESLTRELEATLKSPRPRSQQTDATGAAHVAL